MGVDDLNTLIIQPLEIQAYLGEQGFGPLPDLRGVLRVTGGHRDETQRDTGPVSEGPGLAEHPPPPAGLPQHDRDA